MARGFVVISGLPASGKTRLAPRLGLPLIDKDEILEALLSVARAHDAARRRALSRRSDELLEQRASASEGAVLVSFWRVPGMTDDSGTPTAWLHALRGPLVHVRCSCPPELAARRFLARRRHAGHLDAARSAEAVLADFEALARLAPLDLGPEIAVDTATDPDLDTLAGGIAAHFSRAAG